MELSWHTSDHVIEVRIEVASLRDIETEGWVVVIAGHQVVSVINDTWAVGLGL